ncbi:Disease resistance protein L6 [Linum perenne]
MLDLGSQGVKVVGLHGMGGIGKTTLATTVYNKVSAHFDRYSFVKDIRETQKQHGALILQKNLISDILKMDSVGTIVEAKKIIRERVAQFKIFVVLDDIDEKFDFEEVLGNSKSFASGSRFIVTSRDIKVLRRLSGGQSKLYKVQGMSLIHSLQVFCKHAFKKDSPQSGFEELSNAIISTAGGLPLTLKVIGSLLYQEEEVVWKEKLKQLRKIPEEEVMERLKISYDGLRYEAQQIFLDIACFYIGENKGFPSYMWSGCNFHPILYVNILVQRSMLEIGDDNVFLMHDQLRDMGREIVRREDIEHPWMRSRIWSNKEAQELLLNNKEANKLKVLILGDGLKMSKLLEFPKSGSLEILDIEFSNKEEDLKIEKLRNLKVLILKDYCKIGKIKGGTIGMMKELRELNLCGISCDYNTFRQTIVDIQELSSLQILNVHSHHLVNVLKGIKLPKSLKKLNTSSGFANVEELLDLEEFTIFGSEATTELAIPPAASSRGGDTTNSTIIPWINSSKLKSMELKRMKRITMVESKDTLLPSSLTKLTIYSVYSERIPNLKNLRNLTKLKIEECPNLEEIQGMGGLKSLRVLRIERAKELTSIHGLGNLMSCSSCKLTTLEIRYCPLLREVVTFEQQDDDDGGSEGERERDVLVQIESLVKMEIQDTSIDWRSIPRLSKFPKLKELKINNIGLNINEESASQQEHQPLEGLENLEELVSLSISNVELKRILNLENLGKLTDLELRECRNLEEVQGMEGLKSLQVLRIVGAQKLTRIHGLGDLMSYSNCKLNLLVICECPLLREVATFEQQDHDDGSDGDGSDGDGDHVDDVDDFLFEIEIWILSSIDGRSRPSVSKYMKSSELSMVLKGTENPEDFAERKLLFSFLSKLRKRLIHLLLEDVPALQEEIVGPGDLKELRLIMNGCLSLERWNIKDLPYSTLHRIEFELYGTKTMSFDFDLSSLTTEGGDHLGELRLNITWPHEELSDAESNG